MPSPGNALLGIGVWQRWKAVALAGAEVVHCNRFLAAIDTRVAVAEKLDAGRSIRLFEKADRTTSRRYHCENWLGVILARTASFAYPRRLLRVGASQQRCLAHIGAGDNVSEFL